MSACTVYICSSDPETCAGEVRRRAGNLSMEVHPLLREAPGDKFSRLVLGTANHARTQVAADSKHPIHGKIFETTVIVGIPDGISDGTGAFHPGIAELTAGIDAFVFDGQTFRDPSGRDLMA